MKKAAEFLRFEIEALEAEARGKKYVDKGSRRYRVYAVDFDGTLCESVWPGIGEPNMALIDHLKKRRSEGNKIILWTCRVGDRLREAVEWCRERGLEFDAVNENLPEMIEKYGGDTRKIFADCYINDKNVNKPKYQIPFVSTKKGTMNEQEQQTD